MFQPTSHRPISPQRSQTGARPASPQPQPVRPPLGNQALQHLLRSGIQAKLTINQPGDSYEQEADRVAESVMRMPEPGGSAPAITPLAESGLQKKCVECAAEEEEEKQEVQRKAIGPAPDAANPHVEAQVRSLEGGGSSLAPDVRGFFEPRFGRDLSAVRIHTEGPAADSARQLQARAYTRGSHIVFAAGEYAPHSSAGRRLLAHELTHVAQQAGCGGSLARAPIQRQCSSANMAVCTDEDLLTAVCMGEAGTMKDADGQQGVMNVVQNQANDPKFPGNLRDRANEIFKAERADTKRKVPPGIDLLGPKADVSCRPLAKKVGGGDPTGGAVFFDQCCQRPCEQFCTGYLGDGTGIFKLAHFFARWATTAERDACRNNATNPKSSCTVCGSRPLQAHCDKRCCQKGSVKGAVPGYPGTQSSATEEAPSTAEGPREVAPPSRLETPVEAPAAPATP